MKLHVSHHLYLLLKMLMKTKRRAETFPIKVVLWLELQVYFTGGGRVGREAL